MMKWCNLWIWRSKLYSQIFVQFFAFLQSQKSLFAYIIAEFLRGYVNIHKYLVFFRVVVCFGSTQTGGLSGGLGEVISTVDIEEGSWDYDDVDRHSDPPG